MVSLWNHVFAYHANFALFFTFVLPRSYEYLEPEPVAYSVSIYGSLYCFASFLCMQGVSFFYLFVCSSRTNQMILSLLAFSLQSVLVFTNKLLDCFCIRCREGKHREETNLCKCYILQANNQPWEYKPKAFTTEKSVLL